MPIWADAFANEKQKSIWLSFLILASPLGVVFGFEMTSLFVAHVSHEQGFIEGSCNDGWRYAFFIQCTMMAPMSIGFLLTPLKYLDIDRSNKYREKCQEKVK